MRYSWRRKASRLIGTGRFTLVLLLVIILLQLAPGPEKIKDVSTDQDGSGRAIWDELADFLGMDVVTYKKILALAVPIISEYDPSGGNSGLLEKAAYAFFHINLHDPKSFFSPGLSALGALEVMAASREDEGYFEDEALVDLPVFMEEDIPEAKETFQPPKREVSPTGAQVIIYNTHNAETYAPTDGKSKLEGENAGVVKVAARLEAVLKDRFGIVTARSETIHDYPQFEKSYGNSEVTLKKLLQEHPHAQVVIDVHRDAGQSEAQTVNIHGKKAARVRLIVGSDARLAHPRWRENREFAKMVAEKMEELFPGLSLGYRVQSGRYNQHLHPHSLLIEVGNDLNSLEEALYAAELFAQVIAEIL
ncbi:MAG: stage II sporulation protein P [Clostridia bacterium]|nr:stage II sporulation protein P [Clostridia bacterium]